MSFVIKIIITRFHFIMLNINTLLYFMVDEKKKNFLRIRNEYIFLLALKIDSGG